jgi:hypothetical protein
MTAAPQLLLLENFLKKLGHDALLLLLFEYFTTIFQFELAEFWTVGGGQKLQNRTTRRRGQSDLFWGRQLHGALRLQQLCNTCMMVFKTLRRFVCNSLVLMRRCFVQIEFRRHSKFR